MKCGGSTNTAGWVAVFSAAVIGFLVVIPMRMAGYFFVIIIDNYGVDRQQATYPIVVFGMLRSLTGPFIGFLGQHFGLRIITVIGCLLAAVGISACYWAPDIVWIVIFLGIIHGIGIGFGTSLVPEILKKHFSKNINMAVGIYGAGSCLSAIVLPPVLGYFTREFGNSGMFLILGAVVLNSVPAAIMLTTSTKCEANPNLKVFHRSSILIDIDVKETKPTDASDRNLREINKAIIEMQQMNLKDKADSSSRCRVEYTQSQKRGYVNAAFQKDDSYDNSKSNNPKHDDSENSNHFITDSPTNLIKKSQKLDASETNWEALDREINRNNKVSDKQDSSKTKKSLQLFLDPTYYVTMIAQSAHGFVTTLTWTILIDFSRDIGISIERSMYFLMFLPVAELFGNLCLNWVTDRGYVGRTKYCILCYVIIGLDMLLIVWSNSFVLMMVGVLIFGCVSGTLFVSFPGMIFEYFEEDQQSMALTSRFFLYALLCMTKTPIIGHFRGTLGSYNWVFYIIILICFLSAMFVSFTPWLASRRRKSNIHA